MRNGKTISICFDVMLPASDDRSRATLGAAAPKSPLSPNSWNSEFFSSDLRSDTRVSRSSKFIPHTFPRADWIILWQGYVATI